MGDCKCVYCTGTREDIAELAENYVVRLDAKTLQCAKLERERDTLRAENQRLREMLQRVTEDDVRWAAGDGGGECPWCRGDLVTGHELSCRFVAARALLAQGQA